MRFFYVSFALAILGIFAAYLISGIGAAYICALLAVLEISLSFDNAVVNAKTLGSMDVAWQKQFFIFGIPIAVFGMRFAFPILIVSIVADLGVAQTFWLALDDPQSYHEHLSENKGEIYMFGGAFLLMVALEFFCDEREISWIKFIEDNALIRIFRKIDAAPEFIAICVGAIMIYLTNLATYALAYFSAIILHRVLEIFSQIFSADGVKSGIAGFLYLEILDASFSFDGVIGAFAMSENIFIIMLGLGIGAMFVRSLTIFMVKTHSLETFKYLEHGANYAILALAIIMFADVFYEISEIITGTISFALILSAFLCSLRAKNA